VDSLAILTDGFLTSGGGLSNAYIISWGFLGTLETWEAALAAILQNETIGIQGGMHVAFRSLRSTLGKHVILPR